MQDSPFGKGVALLYIPWKFDMVGGVDVVVERLWHPLVERYPGRALIGVGDWEREGEHDDAEGRQFLWINLIPPPSSDGQLSLRYLLTLARRLPRLWWTLRRRNITLINVHFLTLNAASIAILKRLGLWRGRFIATFHGSDVNGIQPDSPLWRLIAQEVDAVTACSSALAERIRALDLFRQPIQVIHNGIDCDRFVRAADVQSSEHGSYLLNVGNYVSRKGQDVLLRAFARIAGDHPSLSVVCAGGPDNGEWLAHLKNLAQELGIAERVRFLENVPQNEVAALMKQASCLVHCAHNEAFGLVLIEAAACGAPIIASRVGGVPEIIESGKTGWLFDDGDVDALEKLLVDVLHQPDSARVRAKRLREHVQNRFSSVAMMKEYLRIYSGECSAEVKILERR